MSDPEDLLAEGYGALTRGDIDEEITAVPGGSRLVRLQFRAVGRGSSMPIEQQVWHVFTFRGDKVASVRGFLNEATAREAAEETT
jgi:ketosteroid isomerase-like protein